VIGPAAGAVRPGPVQAVLLTRPPTLPAGGPVPVTGTIGSAGPDGLVPLSTAFGTLVLRPVPGAWPADLAPGAEIALTIGPGARVGAVRLDPAFLPAAAQAGAAPGPGTDRGGPAIIAPALSARAIGGVEAGVRGLLLPSPGDGPGTLPAAQAVAAAGAAAARAMVGGTAAGQGAPAATAGAAPATVTGPALLAAAAAAQPRLAVATPPAVPVAAEVAPRIATPADTAAPVAAARAGSGTGTGDLLRQAAQRPPSSPRGGLSGSVAGSSGAGGAGAGIPLPPGAALSPDPMRHPAARPDPPLLAALAHPGMMARMAALLPRAAGIRGEGGLGNAGRSDGSGGLALMLYLFGVRSGGGARLWIGEEGLARLTRAERAALEDLDNAMVPGRTTTPDGRSWTTILLPWAEGEELSALLLATPLLPPVTGDGRGDPGADPDGVDQGGAGGGFVLGVEMSALGPVQMRGRMVPAGPSLALSLTLTVAAAPPPALAAAVESVLAPIAPAGLTIRWGSPPDWPDLMPAAGSPALTLRV
jgi:hypothetical protein